MLPHTIYTATKHICVVCFFPRGLLSLLRDKANNVYTDNSTINVRHIVLHTVYDGDKLYNVSGGGNFCWWGYDDNDDGRDGDDKQSNGNNRTETTRTNTKVTKGQ